MYSEHLVPTPILESVPSQFSPFVCEITNALHALQTIIAQNRSKSEKQREILIK